MHWVEIDSHEVQLLGSPSPIRRLDGIWRHHKYEPIGEVKTLRNGDIQTQSKCSVCGRVSSFTKSRYASIILEIWSKKLLEDANRKVTFTQYAANQGKTTLLPGGR